MNPACSPLEARQLDLAERILNANGYAVVSVFIADLIGRWEADPRSLTSEELQAIRYSVAIASDVETGGRVKSLDASGAGTGGGGLRTQTPPPFFPHQRKP